MKTVTVKLENEGQTLGVIYEDLGNGGVFHRIDHAETLTAHACASRLDDLAYAMWKNGLHREFVAALESLQIKSIWAKFVSDYVESFTNEGYEKEDALGCLQEYLLGTECEKILVDYREQDGGAILFTLKLEGETFNVYMYEDGSIIEAWR